ncbi:MAG: cytidine deaminase [Polyangiales bacterium]
MPFDRPDDAAFEPLITEAFAAQDRAYAPYSKFHVGAALLCEDGTIVPGCNVENASYGGTLCAERSAVVSAISQGKRGRFRACVVVTNGPEPSHPCGFCRQVLFEFARDLPILLVARNGGARKLTNLRELLPGGFGPEELG